MTYAETENFISEKLSKGSIYGLDRIKELLSRLSNPQKDMKIIHIAGTNGKGSISRMLMGILCSAGYNVGIFNSPFLSKRNEYLCCNGIDANDLEYSLIAGIVKNAVLGSRINQGEMALYPTEFEFSFAMALEYFSRKNCDFAIIECGLGGKDDATNIFDEKELSILANIGLDHVKLLGDNLKDIAKQKCGIIIKNDMVVAYPSDKLAMNTIKRCCKAKDAKLITPNYIEFGTMTYYNPGFSENDEVLKNEKLWLNMPMLMDNIALDGSFQKKNGMVALAAAAALIGKGYRIPYKAILNGLKSVKWPGRFETLCKSPLIIADGGHNVQCAKALCESLDSKNIKKAIFVVGIMADKDYPSVFKLLKPYVEFLIATEPDNPRRLPAEEILAEFRNSSLSNEMLSIKDPKEALKSAIEIDKTKFNNKLPIIITGSLYMMGDIRDSILEII